MDLNENNKFEALKFRLGSQIELLYRLTQIDHSIFKGFLTIQLLVGAWIATNNKNIDSISIKVGISFIDISIAIILICFLYLQKQRREEVVVIVKNCSKALRFKEVGYYLEGESLEVDYKPRYWFRLYVIGVIAALSGFMIALFGVN